MVLIYLIIILIYVCIYYTKGIYEKIAQDPALVESLADKLDAEPQDVQTELNLMLVLNGKKVMSLNQKNPPITTSNTASTSCCLCCCFGSKKSKPRALSNTNTIRNGINNSNGSNTTKPNTVPHPDIEIKQKLVTFAGPPHVNTIQRK